MASPRDLVLLFDGVCGFCDRTVRFVLARDRDGSMRFAPLQGEFARDVFARHPELRGADSLVLVESPGRPEERVATRSEAVLRIAAYIGGSWRVLALFRIVPRAVRDAGYTLFARFRYRLFGRYDTCAVPSPEERSRFVLDPEDVSGRC